MVFLRDQEDKDDGGGRLSEDRQQRGQQRREHKKDGCGKLRGGYKLGKGGGERVMKWE